MKKAIWISGPLLLLFVGCAFFVLTLCPGFNTKYRHISGVVTAIYEDGTKDAVFKISGQPSVFYINRGLEKHFNLKGLLDKLKGKSVSIAYTETWSPYGTIAECRPISEISTDQETVYSELTEE